VVSGSLLVLTLATVLRGVPSFMSALADGAVPEPAFLDGAFVVLAAGAAMAALAGIALVVARRQGSRSEVAAAEAERRIEATDQKVAAALKRRTLNRGRVRFDNEQPARSPGRPSEKRTARAIRRSG